ncbi:MoxR-like ATPase [Nocardioides scoriae]|uniref:MoxR-like ATPase n=1 Tax=Nocardioides scoriae TaxID=642780 RepID=A0A1H1XQC5_9ACTN|nr:MoxR family ATPase [Nocardioides scoriae]SDT11019.1 MoxR-like ATPase [Nocardioides scoriae]
MTAPAAVTDPDRPGGTEPVVDPAVDPVVDRARETELLEAALRAGAHVVLEGPPGTGKSTLLRALAGRRSSALVLVEGNAELTPARLVGHFDPAMVLERGYDPAVFVDGPLLTAMRGAGLLYLEELNRVPEETLNVLLTVMSEREISVPRLGTVRAAPGFGIVAAMNPYDAVGTARVSSAVYDRTCRIVMGYQSAESETAILTQRAPVASPEWAAQVVALVRATREHPELRVGSSVRGTIDLAGMVHELARSRGVSPTHWRTGLDAALVALSGRVKVDESSNRTPEEVVEELYVATFGAEPAADADPTGERSQEAPGEA